MGSYYSGGPIYLPDPHEDDVADEVNANFVWFYDSLAHRQASMPGTAQTGGVHLSGASIFGSVGVTAGLTAASVAASGAVTGASVAASGAVSGATLASSGNTTVGGALGVTGAITASNATSPIISAKIGPTLGQQHTLPAVASDTVTLNNAVQTLTNKTFSGGLASFTAIDNTPIGQVTPHLGTFTTLTATTTHVGTVATGAWAATPIADAYVVDALTINAGTITSTPINAGTITATPINASTIGATTPASGAFTTLASTTSATLVGTVGIGAAGDAVSQLAIAGIRSIAPGAAAGVYGLNMTSLTIEPDSTFDARFIGLAGTIHTGTTVARTVPNAYGIRVGAMAQTGVGAVVNAIGLYLAAQTIGNTANWALYADGAVRLAATTIVGAATISGTLNTHTIPGGTDTFAMLAATQTLTNKAYSGGTMNATIIGNTNPAAAVFTTLTATTTHVGTVESGAWQGTAIADAYVVDAITINAGTITATPINASTIGATTPASGAFTTLSSSGVATLNSLGVTAAATVGTTLTVTGPTILNNTLAVALTSTFTGNVGIGDTPGTYKLRLLSPSDTWLLEAVYSTFSTRLSYDQLAAYNGASPATLHLNFTDGAVAIGASTTGTAGALGINTVPTSGVGLHVLKTSNQLRLGRTAAIYSNLDIAATGEVVWTTTDGAAGTNANIVFKPLGNITLWPSSGLATGDVLPNANYRVNLGSLTSKYLTLHASELVVETLVAADKIGITGGRVLIGPTTVLTRDLTSVATTIYVKHNHLRRFDRTYMEKDGRLEWYSVETDPATEVDGDYSHTVVRNLDGTGGNAWLAGDAMFNTGISGSGWHDLFAMDGMTKLPLSFLHAYNTATGYGSNFASTAGGFNLFGGTAVGTITYFGVSGATWNNLYFAIDPDQPGAFSATLIWEYWSSAGGWTAFTPTQKNLTDFQGSGWYGVEWTTASLTNWTAVDPASIGIAYYVRVRVSAVSSWTTTPRQRYHRVNRGRGHWGPTHVMWRRNSTTFNDITEHYAAGNLVGLYGYGVETWGVAMGEYAAGKNHLTIDSTNGFRIFNGLSTVKMSIDVSGVITVGQVAAGEGNVVISAGKLTLNNNATERVSLTSAGTLTINDSAGAAVFTFNASAGAEFTKFLTLGASAGIYQGTGTAASPTTGLKLWNDGGIGRIGGYNTGTLQWYANTDGRLYAAGGQLVLDSGGLQFIQTTGTNFLTFRDAVGGNIRTNMYSFEASGTTYTHIGANVYSTSRSIGVDFAIEANDWVSSSAHSAFIKMVGDGTDLYHTFYGAGARWRGVSIGAQVVPVATLDVRGNAWVTKTTEQMRWRYDASNYASATVSSAGNLTIAPTGGVTSLTGALNVSAQPILVRGHTSNSNIATSTWVAIAFNFDRQIEGSSITYSAGPPARITVSEAGQYDVCGGVEFSSHATGVRFGMITRFNSSDVAQADVAKDSRPGGASGQETCISLAAGRVKCAAGDYFVLYGWQDSTATLTLGSQGYCFLSVAKYG